MSGFTGLDSFIHSCERLGVIEEPSPSHGGGIAGACSAPGSHLAQEEGLIHGNHLLGAVGTAIGGGFGGTTGLSGAPSAA